MRSLLFVLVLCSLFIVGWGYGVNQAPPPETEEPNGYMYPDKALNEAYLSANKLNDTALKAKDEKQRQELLVASTEIYSKLLTQLPNDGTLLLNRAGNYMELGMYEQALDDYNRLLTIETNSIDGLFGRGVAYERSGELELSLRDYETILHIAEKSDFLQKVRGALLELVRQKAEALGAELDKIGAKKLEVTSEDSSIAQEASDDALLSQRTTSAQWFGSWKSHYKVKNGVIYRLQPGWFCGAWDPSVTIVDNEVFFFVPEGVSGHEAYRWMGSWGWQWTAWHKFYTAPVGWTSPPARNYVMLIPETGVCSGNNAPAAHHKITGNY